MKNLKLRIAYDGTDFLGWQKTLEGTSIESELEKALSRVLQQKIVLQAASRTDRGVHAENQIVNCLINRDCIDCYKLILGVNSQLPSAIVVKELNVVHDNFHPTIDCLAKEYHYYLTTARFQSPKDRFYSWHVGPLNIDAIQKDLHYFIGYHDFRAFCNQNESFRPNDTKRNIFSLKIHQINDETVRFEVIGNHFLYKMVRNIVGTLVYIGKGKIASGLIPEILASQKRPLAGITAPAHGLFLHQVFYDDKERKC